MEERQRPQAPHIVLFVKTRNSPTFDTLTSFLHDLDKVLSTMRSPCFSMRTTSSLLARLAGAYQSANADAIAECLVNLAPAPTRLEAIMHGLALQDTQRLQQRVEQQQLHHRSLEATCLQYREQCERQHTELQRSVAEVRRAVAAERSSLSQLQREKEAVVARRRSVVQDFRAREGVGVTDRASARDERVKALRQLLADMQQLHCACQKLDSQQTVFEGVQARRLALRLVAEESSLEVSIDELFVRLQACAREIGYNVVINEL
ncbi:hypothetical protein JKP88DRAFT_214369 [Tribonema minus]|uniref:Uncharacterized protein n=1 Tax=Tribonema minus TaxID=303371 RepID=A0A836CNI5_9STRA|nr:hypothetical protein JKP88DRAFT_214369 [Tribonema minus]